MVVAGLCEAKAKLSLCLSKHHTMNNGGTAPAALPLGKETSPTHQIERWGEGQSRSGGCGSPAYSP
jgi:hypothetical protein